MTEHGHRPGSVRSFVHGVGALLLTRAELLALETLELKDEFLGNLFTGMLALILLAAGLFSGLLLLWLLAPPVYKAWLLAALSVLLLGAGGALLCRLRRKLAQQATPFATTLQEAGKDWAALTGRKTS